MKLAEGRTLLQRCVYKLAEAEILQGATDHDGHAKFNVVVRGVSLASAFFGLAIKIAELIEKVRPTQKIPHRSRNPC